MVPLALLLWLASELVLYAGLAHQFLGAPLGTAAIAALGAVLGLRAGIIAITWAFAAAYASPAPAMTAGQRLAMMVKEYLAFVLTFIVVLPFEPLWMPRDRLRQCRLPILLVHGYGCSRGVWWWLRRQLEGAGHTVASVSLVPPYTSVGRMVPQLNARVEAVCAATGARQVILVAHSMGGLVCRAYLSRHGCARVAQLVTLASPHAGSELARIGLGRNAREMEPGSRWLRDLATESLGVPTIAVRGTDDNFVMPQDNQRLAGASDVPLPGIGHLALLVSPRTAAILLAAVAGNE